MYIKLVNQRITNWQQQTHTHSVKSIHAHVHTLKLTQIIWSETCQSRHAICSCLYVFKIISHACNFFKGDSPVLHSLSVTQRICCSWSRSPAWPCQDYHTNESCCESLQLNRREGGERRGKKKGDIATCMKGNGISLFDFGVLYQF